MGGWKYEHPDLGSSAIYGPYPPIMASTKLWEWIIYTSCTKLKWQTKKNSFIWPKNRGEPLSGLKRILDRWPCEREDHQLPTITNYQLPTGTPDSGPCGREDHEAGKQRHQGHVWTVPRLWRRTYSILISFRIKTLWNSLSDIVSQGPKIM